MLEFIGAKVPKKNDYGLVAILVFSINTDMRINCLLLTNVTLLLADGTDGKTTHTHLC